MIKEKVILVDDDPKIRESFEYLFEDDSLGMELIACATIDEYIDKIALVDIKYSLRSVIFDLSIKKHETGASGFEIDKFIMDQFNDNRIPIFIHSAYTESYEKFDLKGTVFKTLKTHDSHFKIHSKLKLMKESGFLNVFCFNGELDKKIMTEIHTAFVEQFKQNEIEEIINSIKSATKDGDSITRTIEVFERLAIRAVYQNWMKAKSTDGESMGEVKVNAIEHYYRRKNYLEFWTGDVFIEKETKNMSIILTPRCNIGYKNYDELLFCRIRNISDADLQKFKNTKIDNVETKETKGQKTLRSSITDDINTPLPGERFRFLPKTPQFAGGFVDFKTVYSMNDTLLNNKFEYVISLADDLTNDVVRKLSAYLLRGGISETEYKEAHYYISDMDSKS